MYTKEKRAKGDGRYKGKMGAIVTTLWIMLSFSWVSRVSSLAGLQTLLLLQIPWAVDFSGDAHGSF